MRRCMAIDVVTEIEIDRPRDGVAAYAANPDNAPEWYGNIKSISWETDKRVGVGARMAFVAHFLGRRLAYTYEIREFVAGEKLVMSTDQGPFPMETTYTWESTPSGGTRMTLRNRGEPAGFSKVGAPVMAAAVRRSTRRNLRCLKTLLESRGSKGS
jgi:uncharacterized protein YndB with AHSA1/START domain